MELLSLLGRENINPGYDISDSPVHINGFEVKEIIYNKNTDTLTFKVEQEKLPDTVENNETFVELRKMTGVSEIRIMKDAEENMVPVPENISTEETILQYAYNLKNDICADDGAASAILSNCDIKVDDKYLLISLKSQGENILKSMGIDEKIKTNIEKNLNIRINVEIKDNGNFDEIAKKYENDKEQLIKRSAEIAMARDEKEQDETDRINAPQAADIVGFRKARVKTPMQNNLKKNPGLIVGTDFTDEPIDICDINDNLGVVCIEAEILNLRKIELRGGEKLLYTFDVTDYSGSITAKLFIKKQDEDYFDDRLQVGINVKIRAEALFDRYAREVTLTARDIIELEKAERMDNAPVKRVELHLHTKMSAMDSTVEFANIVERAARWGHKAIAVTDHGVVQAFVDAEATKIAKENGIKLIYGVECYMIQNEPDFMWNMDEREISSTVVILDFETTGLQPEKDQIIEIGAVKISCGSEIDSFHSFINPGRRISEKIKQLTGIKNSYLKDAPTLWEVLPDFIKFIDNAVIVAHNAPFDLGFLTAAIKGTDIVLNSPIIDTVQLSKLELPYLENYKLETVASYFNVNPPGFHRAVDDARTTAAIFNALLSKLREREVKTFRDVWCYYNGNSDPSLVLPMSIDSMFTKKKDANNKNYHCILLAKNKTGLKNLYRIISMSHLAYFYKRPRIPKSRIAALREGLIIGSACEAGELFQAIAEGATEEEVFRISEFYDYLEIQPSGNNMHWVRSGRLKDENEIKDIYRRIVRIGEKTGKPVIAACDVHFIDAKDEIYRRILLAGMKYDDAENQPPLYFRTTEEMIKEFDYLGRTKAEEIVIANTNLIADMIEDGINPVPPGTYPPTLEGAADEVREIALNNAYKLYGDPLPECIADRLNNELKSIIGHGFAVMYSAAYRLVAKSVADGYSVGSRGSVGSSLVATMMGITEVNPLPAHYHCPACRYSDFESTRNANSGFDLPVAGCPKCGHIMKSDGHNIPFETFLGFSGDKAPDIDLNFAGVYQSTAHRYTEELFGSENIFKAGTISTIAEKLAAAYVRKYFEGKNITISSAEERRLTAGCTGVKKTTGQHPGGMIVLPNDMDIHDFTPVQRPADRTGTGVITTHFDFHSLHDTILKLDILGHDIPTLLRELEDLTGIGINDIPIPEQKVMDLFKGTEPLGVRPEDIGCNLGVLGLPEMGTGFVLKMLEEAKPEKFSDLIQISGLSHGTDVWLGNAQELILNGTCTISNVIGTRDSIMITLMEYGLEPSMSFRIMESVRKGRGLTYDYETAMRAKNVPEWYLESCKKIKYMFPKAHAAAYVISALRLGWYKIYKPLEFYASYYTVKGDEFDAIQMCGGLQDVVSNIDELSGKVDENSSPISEDEDSNGQEAGKGETAKGKRILALLKIIREMNARGYNFAPIDIYKSDATRYLICDDGLRIRPPLTALRGFGAAVAGGIVQARKDGDFATVDDLARRSGANKKALELLKSCGALDNLSENRQMSLFDM